MNPVHKGFHRLIFPFLSNKFGNLAVGQQHEILDQLIGILHLTQIDAQRPAEFIKFEPDLLGLKIK